MAEELNPNQKLKKSKKGAFREYTEAIIVAVLIALFLRVFVIEAFKIPTGSMIPTLKIGDHIFVNKFIYGLRIPYTKIRFFDFSKPKRGDVAVFIFPLDNSKDYIKRVIGLPGDTIEVMDNTVYVNGGLIDKALQEDRAILKNEEDTNQFDLFKEQTGGKQHFTQYLKFDEPQHYGPRSVPPDKIFVMGDNRNRSYDSRGWGFVPMSNIKGKAMFIWLSLNPNHRYPWIRLPRIRWERFGKLIR